MSTLHSGWHNERISLLGTLGTPQFVVLGLGLLPALFFLQAQAWILFAVALLSWLLLFAVVALPIRERPAWLWIADGLMHMIGKSTRTDQYTAKAVGSGLSSEEATQFDLPGGLQGFEVFDGPTHAPSDMRRLCVLKDPEGGWVMVARLEHPGLSLTDPDAGDRWASALGDMLSAVARGEQLPHRVSLYVRTVPDDGAERAAWRRANSPTDVPEQVARDAEAVEASVLSQSISHEVYCAIRFRDEALVAGASRSTRRTLDSRIAAMYRALPEVTGLLTSAGCEQVTWLSKGEVAAAVRTGFNPAAAQSIQVARAAKALGFEAFDEVQPAAAGPSAAPSPHARYYDHDGFRSAAYSLILPEMGTQVGSLGPLLTPGQPGERRSLALHYEPFDDKEASKAAEAQSTNASANDWPCVRSRLLMRMLPSFEAVRCGDEWSGPAAGAASRALRARRGTRVRTAPGACVARRPARGSLRTPALGHADRERQDAGDETERLGQVEAHQLELASAG